MIDLETIYKKLQSMYLQKLITYSEMLNIFNKYYHQALVEWELKNGR